MRVTDLAGLTRRSLDLEAGTLSFVAKKTGQRLSVPLAKSLVSKPPALPEVFDSHPRLGDPDGAFFVGRAPSPYKPRCFCSLRDKTCTPVSVLTLAIRFFGLNIPVMSQTAHSPPPCRSLSSSSLTRPIVVGVIAVALAGTASRSAVLVTFDVRAVQNGISPGTTSHGLAFTSADGLIACAAAGSSSIVLQLVATLNATNDDLSDDSFTRIDGSWVTFGSKADISGSFRTDPLTTAGINNVNPFRGTGAKSGAPTELSGTLAGYANDNITDLGGTSTTAFTGYFTASSNLPTGAIGQSFILGETILHLNPTAGVTNVRFVPRFAPTGLAGNRTSISFKVDGVSYALDGQGARVSGGNVDPDAVQYRSVRFDCAPEPNTFSLIVPALIALAGFRRRRA